MSTISRSSSESFIPVLVQNFIKRCYAFEVPTRDNIVVVITNCGQIRLGDFEKQTGSSHWLGTIILMLLCTKKKQNLQWDITPQHYHGRSCLPENQDCTKEHWGML
ncbi:hypothetical protein L596_025291 [Steinernema carpocapsae]|uniref:Uncharacterized protein n=1 Tax=Steinernema carpocapsae TaxID=34508 RepID=A0A4U5M7J5_STECR|nr:hypothetical protein L596_025291 [Steinernema carpocapsae]